MMQKTSNINRGFRVWMLILILVTLLLAMGRVNAQSVKAGGNDKDSLFNEIAMADSLLFSAYNAHDLSRIRSFFTEDLEFFHDLGGLTNYAQNMEAFKSNFEKNNGLRRDLVLGTMEVYPVKGYGAMQIGSHTFCHLENGKQDCGTFKFAMVWKKTRDGWKIARVLSYGH
jgi:ketosteroid isomerase-like protein